MTVNELIEKLQALSPEDSEKSIQLHYGTSGEMKDFEVFNDCIFFNDQNTFWEEE